MKKFKGKIMSLIMCLFMIIGTIGSGTTAVLADGTGTNDKTIHVSMIIDGYEGNILTDESIEATEGETVCSMFERQLTNKGISYTNNSESSPYISKINGESEFDRGVPKGTNQSGWKYSVNGTFPNVGCGGVKLEDGDKVHWIYVQGAWDESQFRDVDSITLDKTNLKLKVNETQTLIAAVNPDNATDKGVTWKSSDETVATVDAEGNVTALKEGQATITVGSVDNDNTNFRKYVPKTASCNVIVGGSTSEVTTVSSISLDTKDANLTVGDTKQLNATVEPDNATNKSVIWTSKDSSIATVDQNGKVTSVKVGTTTITATTVDGGKTDSCNITINSSNPSQVAVNGISLNTTKLNLSVGGIIQLNATVVPDNATNKTVNWTSSDPTIATVDSTGKVIAVKEGTATITAATQDGNKEATCSINVKNAESKDYATAINNLINGISSTIKTSDDCDDWLALGLNKTGKDIPKDYLSKIEQKIKDATKDGVLDLGNTTEYERISLAVLACGGDPANISGQNLIEKIYNSKNMSDQGINAYVFGLIALDASNFNVPDNAIWTRQKLIDKILDNRTKDGGWSYGGSTADPDMTGMAISALSPYVSSNNDIKTAVNNAIDTLSQIQDTDDGGFKTYGTKNSESISQAIIGLYANGIDPTIDGRFIKNGYNPMDALLTFASSDNKGFGHTDTNINGMGTEQGLEALAAYNLFKAGKGSLYKFISNVNPDPGKKTIDITNLTTDAAISLGSDAKVSIKAVNNSDKDQDVSLIIALYDNKDQFVDYVCGKQTIKKEDSSILTSMMQLPSQGIYKLKAFVWDSIESMNPLSDTIEIPVK